MMLKPELAIAQTMGEKPVYHMNDLSKITESRATAYRILSRLREAGFAEQVREGYFTFRSSLFQSFYLWSNLLPSLQSLQQSPLFGLFYNENDLIVARQILNAIVTLTYRAYEITLLRSAHLFSISVSIRDKAAQKRK